MTYFKIKNENNLPMEDYGKMILKNLGDINKVYHEMGDGIYMDFNTPWAKHNERFVARFDREVEGVRIYNVIESYLL